MQRTRSIRLVSRLISSGGDGRVAHVHLFPPAVSALLEEGRQQAADHAAAEEALQESDHPGLQDAGAGAHQHGRGTRDSSTMQALPLLSLDNEFCASRQFKSRKKLQLYC